MIPTVSAEATATAHLIAPTGLIVWAAETTTDPPPAALVFPAAASVEMTATACLAAPAETAWAHLAVPAETTWARLALEVARTASVEATHTVRPRPLAVEALGSAAMIPTAALGVEALIA